MSSSTAIIYGRGFETNKIRFKTVLQFIKNHYQTIQNNIPNGNFIVKICTGNQPRFDPG